MSPLDHAVIRRKLQVIVENLRDLREVQNMGFEAYRASRFEKKATERWLQELIEAAIDVNIHILSGLGLGVPESNYETFIAIGERKILPRELARRLAPAAGLRNRLVHEYEDLDDRRVWEAIGQAQELFPRYLKSIEELLARPREPK
jgi:uncharacterized protein YutE (UPF0331/DUF86 family)